VTIRLTSSGTEDTLRIAGTFASGLRAGDVVLLAGDLGAGKTTFVRGAARRLGYNGPVASPTFTIGRVYNARPPIAHLDLYRLLGSAAEDPGLLDEYLHPSRIAFIEWPNADPGLIAELEAEGRRVMRIDVRHGEGAGDRRVIELPSEVAG